MYRAVVRRKIRAAFSALSRGDADALLAQMSPDVHHTFPGSHALGGERSNREDVAAWLARLFRLFPGLQFHLHALAVDGPPWNTVIGAEWTNTGTLLDGSTYTNAGAHVLRLRWGRLTSFHAYLHDAQESADALARLAAHGITEAAAAPITSTSRHTGTSAGSSVGQVRSGRAAGAVRFEA